MAKPIRRPVKHGATKPLGNKADAPNAPPRSHHPGNERPSVRADKSKPSKIRTRSVLESQQLTKDDLVEYIVRLLAAGYRKAQIRQAVRELYLSADPTTDPTRPIDVVRIDNMIAEAQKNIKRYSTLDLRSLKKIAIDTLLGGTNDDRVDYRSKAYGVSVLSEVLDLKNVSLVDDEDVAKMANAAQDEIDSDHALDRDDIARLHVEAEAALEKAKLARRKAQGLEDDDE